MRFLRGPSCDEFKSFASLGPIIFLNVSRFGSDAYIITHDDIRCLPLPKLTYDDVTMKSEMFLRSLKNDRLISRRHTNPSMGNILEWLWDVAVESVLDDLGFSKIPQNDDSWPHVWWIPVGRLSLFPIHAAGYHSTPGQNALDRVISSYTPTGRALEHVRNQIKNLSRTATQTVLLALTPITPDQSNLPCAEREGEVINNVLPHSIKRIILLTPTKLEVEECIEECSIAHFACHGEVNPDPSKSCILFSDWKNNSFSVSDMARKNLKQTELAYIAACHTADNWNLNLLDESIHMAAACQLAGFPTVIGTLWHIPDTLSVSIAQDVYNAMLIGDKLVVRKAAQGLHFAVRKARNQSLQRWGSKGLDPMAWAPYVHVGV